MKKNSFFNLLLCFIPILLSAQVVDTSGLTVRVDSLLKASQVLVNQRKFEEAIQIIDYIEKPVAEQIGKSNQLYGNILYNKANAFLQSNQAEDAEPLYREAIVIFEHLSGKPSIEFGGCLVNLGLLLTQWKGEYDEAELLLLRAKDLFENQIQNTKLRFYANCLGNLSYLYREMGRMEEAESLGLSSLAAREAANGKETGDYVDALGNLSNFYQETGDWDKAEQMSLEAKQIAAKVLGKQNAKYAFIVADLATFYKNKGNYEKAEPAYLESLEILKNTLGEESIQYSIVLSNFGNFYRQKGDLQKAEPNFLKAKDTQSKLLPKNHPRYANTLNNLGLVYTSKKEFANAESTLTEALAIYAISPGKEQPIYAMGLENLAVLYEAMKAFDKAEPLHLESYRILNNYWGDKNPDSPWSPFNLGVYYSNIGNHQAAEKYFAQALGNLQKVLKTASPYNSESEMRSYSGLYDEIPAAFYAFALEHTQISLADECFNYILFSKCALLENALLREKSVIQADTETRNIYTSWKKACRQLGQQFSLPVADQENIQEFEEKANQLEKELSRRLAGFDQTRLQANWLDIRNQLKPSEAAVEFIHYRHSTDSIMYAALVVRPGDPIPSIVPLFEEKELLPLLRGTSGGSNFLKINALYAQKGSANKQKALNDLIWQPMESLLTDVHTVYAAPSGLLHRINLAAITSVKGLVFGDHTQLVILGSTRQLVIPDYNNQTGTANAFLAGGIRYDSDSTSISYANRGITSRSLVPNAFEFQPDSMSITRGGVLDYLPATAVEVQAIGQMLQNAGHQITSDTGFNATEESFRQLGAAAPSPRIIHLATHGYFFPDPGKPNDNSGQGSIFKKSEHPMIRSGLIMAGAKQAWLTGKHPEGLEDGILTAYEISQMNLSGTELVVLSACETGLGDIVGNEGVYGLQRAFKIAGAKYLVMSLWKVDDQSTREFMTIFYQHWLMEKQSIPLAFRTTQQEMRSKHPNAYDWAGFVLIE